MAGNSLLLTSLLIVETEIPRIFDTSFMFKNGRFCEFMWWEYGGEIYQNRFFFNFIFPQQLSVLINLNPARGVYFQDLETSGYVT